MSCNKKNEYDYYNRRKSTPIERYEARDRLSVRKKGYANHDKRLLESDIEAIEISGYFDIAERYISEIPLNRQLDLIKQCLRRAKTLREAAGLILANYEELVKEEKVFYQIVRAYCGNQIYKNNQLASIRIASSLGKYFMVIPKHDRMEMLEMLVRSRNAKTEKSIRKLFYSKFNKLPFLIKNRMLKSFILDKNTPEYFFRSFLTQARKGVSEKNKNLIVERLNAYGKNDNSTL